ncbi:cell division ABC transporter ATP-binding protein FtsE, partial [Candidatus Magnetoovum chiemensis]
MAFITGPSGAGKTTIFKLLYLADKPDTGKITISGYNTSKLKDSSIPYLRRNIGVIFQDFKLLNNKTVYDNIALTLRIRGIIEREIKERVHSVLKMVNLRHKADNYPLSLSGGEQQRITIARAIVGEPTVMLADEPTGNLDAENEKYVMNIFKEINAKGTTILIATHSKELTTG